MALIFLAVAIFLRPFPRGGMDGTNYALTLLTIGGMLAALVAVHLAFAYQLWNAPSSATDAEVARIRSKRKARS
jgi:hypothetical protein